MRPHNIAILGILVLTFPLAFAGDDEKSGEQNDVDYWLKKTETQPVSSQTDIRRESVNPFAAPGGFSRDDAIPGVVELSDDTQLPGGVFTTRGKPWIVWVAAEKRWRLIPPGAVLSVEGVIVEEKMLLKWRWKATGQPEKVYTGEKYPFRRFEWKFHLADDSEIQGVIKGQPLWVESGDKTHGPFVLGERSKGAAGQSLKELVYVRKIVLSRKMMEIVKNANRQQAVALR